MKLIHPTLLFTLGLGFAIVLQGGLNRRLGETWGLPGVVFLNALSFLLASALFFWIAKTYPGLVPAGFENKKSFNDFSWWYLLPGFFGFFFVIGVPYSISKIGALEVFVGLIAAQMVGGTLWDYFVEDISLNPLKILGAIFAILSVALVSWRQ